MRDVIGVFDNNKNSTENEPIMIVMRFDRWSMIMMAWPFDWGISFGNEGVQIYENIWIFAKLDRLP